MGIALRYAARSDIGLGRYSNNQDSGYAGPHLLAVCDGMGGHAGGDVASSTALGRLVELDGQSHGGDAVALLSQKLRDANAELRHRVDHEPRLAGMGTTATILMRYGSKMALAHIGDSRAYLLRDGQLTRLTRDHTFVQSLVDEGRITEEEAEQHPQRSIITRVLSGDPDDEPDLSVREARLGDRYLLCSDGLTAVVSDPTLAEALAEHDTPAGCAEALVQMALRGGGPDNITCVVAYVVDASSGDASTLPEVVGAATVHGTVRTEAATSSPAARAAALGRGSEGGGDATSTDEDPAEVPAVGPPASAKRWLLRGLATLLVMGLLSAGGYAAYAWSQKQYFVGADAGQVAIYRGLPQDIGPVRLSSVYERQDVALSALPAYSQEQVRSAITADDLADARTKVKELREQALDCPTAPFQVPTLSPSTSPTATTAPTTSPTTSPTSATTAAPTTTPPAASTASPTVPAGCGSTG